MVLVSLHLLSNDPTMFTGSNHYLDSNAHAHAHLRSSVSTVSFLDRMCPRIRALELPPPAAALRDVDPVPRSRSFLWRANNFKASRRKLTGMVLIPLSRGLAHTHIVTG